jgi:hypothetical protein
MRIAKASMLGAFLVLSSFGSAQAATVSSETGTVLVRTQDGFTPVAGASNVAPGTQVMVSPGGVARISYGGECVVRLGSGRVWTVTDGVPCTSGQKVVDMTGATRMASGSTKDTGVVGAGPFADAGGIVLGGTMIGMGIAGIVYAASGNGSGTAAPPASP